MGTDTDTDTSTYTSTSTLHALGTYLYIVAVLSHCTAVLCCSYTICYSDFVLCASISGWSSMHNSTGNMYLHRAYGATMLGCIEQLV